MPGYSAAHEVRHSAQQMFALIADVERYPEFVPRCTGMRVLGREKENGREIVFARMTVAAGPVKESFTNRIVLDHAALTISVRATDGPFKRMENDWAFEPLGPSSCRVRFSIAYEFRSLALRLLLGAVSDAAFGHYVEAFERRADAIYRDSQASV